MSRAERRAVRSGQLAASLRLTGAAHAIEGLERIVTILRSDLDAAYRAHRTVTTEVERREDPSPLAVAAAAERARCLAEIVALLRSLGETLREILPGLAAEVAEGQGARRE